MSKLLIKNKKIEDNYNLINSMAIRNYYIENNYNFSIEDIIILISINKEMSIKEKISKYQNLLIENAQIKADTKNTILNEISRLNKLSNNFYKCSENSFYIWNNPSVFSLDSLFLRELNTPNTNSSDINLKIMSKTFEEAGKNIINYVNSMKKYTKIKYIIIKKIDPNNNLNIYGYFKIQNNELELIDITDGMQRKLTTEKLNIPLPFKKGDIVVSKSVLEKKNKVFIFDSLNRESDVTTCYGYCLYNNDSTEIVKKEIKDFDTLEYYDGELKENYRILKLVSSFLQEKISLELFMSSYNYLKLQNELNQNTFHKFFTDEDLKNTGIDEENIKIKF